MSDNTAKGTPQNAPEMLRASAYKCGTVRGPTKAPLLEKDSGRRHTTKCARNSSNNSARKGVLCNNAKRRSPNKCSFIPKMRTCFSKGSGLEGVCGRMRHGERPNKESAFGKRIQAEDNRQQTTDNRQQTTDNRQQTTDNRQQTTDNILYLRLK